MREALEVRNRRGAQRIIPSSLPAPTGGWDASTPIANMRAEFALVLDNFFPTQEGVKVRHGFQVHAAGMGSGVVEAIMGYHGATSASSKLFAATDGSIWDITASGLATVSSVTGMTSNRWRGVNMTVSGGHYLWICNGSDDPHHFNGSVWATPSLSLTTFSADNIINVNVHKGRLWVVFRDSLVAGYLATGAIAGTVTNFPLGGVFTKGGHLKAMATWTRDGGAGEDDLAVFISSEGQIAVYAGTDPSSANTWGLVGVYDVGPPIGFDCFTKVGGDIALINIDGVLSLEGALSQDRGNAADVALTKRINSVVNSAARNYKNNFGWQLCVYPKGPYVALNVPISEGVLQHQYVMNSQTGAWCRFTGQDANCWEVWDDNLYFGGNDGLVYQADQTALDSTTPIDAIGQCAYSYFGSRGVQKDFLLLQAVLTTDSNLRPALGISTDFKDNASLGTPTAAENQSALFDSAVFDTDVFAIEGRTVSDWATISGNGYSASVHFRTQTGQQSVSLWGLSQWGQDPWSESLGGDVNVQLNGFNILHERGNPL